jgi:hypothetical protein
MPEPTLQTDWNNEYNFWHKIISEEVERLRFNEGYEPIRFDLYPSSSKNAPPFVGETRVGHVRFKVTGRWAFDREGKKSLKIEILKSL